MAPPATATASLAAATTAAPRKGSAGSGAWRHSRTNATDPRARSRKTIAMSRSESPVSGSEGLKLRKSSPSSLRITWQEA